MFQSSAASLLRTVVLQCAWVAFCVLGASSIIISIILIPIAIAGYEASLDSALGTFGLYAGQYVSALIVLLTIPYLRLKGKWKPLLAMIGLARRPRLTDVVLAVGSWIGYFIASFVALTLVAVALPGLDLDQIQQIGFDVDSLQPYEYVLAFIALAILPPIAEEAIFRGYLFGKLRDVSGFWFSALITSLLFGLVHLQINVGIDVFILSMFLCYLREKTGSIWAPIFLHSIKNSIAYVFLFVVK